VLAVTSTVLSVAAHVVPGNVTPDIGVTALLTVGVAVVGIAVADRRSLGTVLLTLGTAQIGMHVPLSTTSDIEQEMASPVRGPPMAVRPAGSVAPT
jgi:hypothetical protein